MRGVENRSHMANSFTPSPSTSSDLWENRIQSGSALSAEEEKMLVVD